MQTKHCLILIREQRNWRPNVNSFDCANKKFSKKAHVSSRTHEPAGEGWNDTYCHRVAPCEGICLNVSTGKEENPWNLLFLWFTWGKSLLTEKAWLLGFKECLKSVFKSRRMCRLGFHCALFFLTKKAGREGGFFSLVIQILSNLFKSHEIRNAFDNVADNFYASLKCGVWYRKWQLCMTLPSPVWRNCS